MLNSDNLQEALDADMRVEKPLRRIFALAESYPDLKASDQFMNLQNELANTEDKIAKTRQFYNDTILIYNNAIQTFPSNLIAGMMGFNKKEFLQKSNPEEGRL